MPDFLTTPEKPNKRYYAVEVGGAPLSYYIARASNSGPVLIIDPLVGELTQPLLEILEQRNFISIISLVKKVIPDKISPGKKEAILSFYQSIAQVIRIPNITLINDRIENVSGVYAQTVNLEYPSPLHISPASILRFGRRSNASKILVKTEDKDYSDLLEEELIERGLNFTRRFIDNKGIRLPNSPYELILGIPNYYFFEIDNSNLQD